MQVEVLFTTRAREEAKVVDNVQKRARQGYNGRTEKKKIVKKKC